MRRGYPVCQIRFTVLYGRLVREFNIARDGEWSADEREFSLIRCRRLLNEIVSLMKAGSMKTKKLDGDIASLVYIETYLYLSENKIVEEVL